MSAISRIRPVATAAVVIAALAVVGVVVTILPEGSTHGRRTLVNPIDPRQARVAFGQRSHWLQPWRGYLDTPPAARLRDAIGINFDVEPNEADATARLLSSSGFKRARVEFGWDSLSYDNPDQLRDPNRFAAILGALRRYHVRPLILLNANHNAPGPIRFLNVSLAAPAAQGAKVLRLTRASAERVRPGHTGLNDANGKAADVLFTSVRADGSVTLSKPLPRALGPGTHPAATLRYEPFGPPRLPGGRPNPRFETTMNGWIAYARTITRQARAVLGGDAFDVEIWNELSFGSDFLSQERYYSPPRERGSGDVTRVILARTVSALRGESPSIGIGDGFATQTPFASGATSPVGLTAIDKHPYYAIMRFPSASANNAVEPLDARGHPAAEQKRASDGTPIFKDAFVPTYDAFFPEYALSAIQTETLIRDLSPFTTDVNGTPHGRQAHPPGGKPPEVWVTEANLDPTGADPTDPASPGSGPIDRLKPDDVAHLHAKAALRYYVAFVSKGVSAVDLFAVKGGEGGGLSLVDPGFFRRLAGSGGAYPGDAAGGETPRAVSRLVRALGDGTPIGAPRPLSLLAVSDVHGHVQFEGDPGASGSFPPLYDRDVLAFFPFQLAPGRWVAAVYVMTRSLAKPYGEGSAPDRYDLPEEKFRITVGGVNGARLRARLSDPLSGRSARARVVARAPRQATIELAATDSPRLLRLSER